MDPTAKCMTYAHRMWATRFYLEEALRMYDPRKKLYLLEAAQEAHADAIGFASK